jgi:adenylate cyclase
MYPRAVSDWTALMARRLAAILAADVVGYSRLMAADERDTHERLKVLRKDFIEPTIAEHRGRVVKLTGDGALVEFASVVDSVECAAAIQNCVAERQSDVPEDQRIALRIGVNIGDIIIEDDDIYGDGVNVAARLESLAEPGGICVSRTVYDHAKNKVALGFQPMGEHVVKNIPEPVVVYRVTPAGAAAGAPWTAGATDRARRNVPAIVVAIALVIGGGAASWVWSRSNTPSDASPSPAAEPILAMPTGPTVAVLPFNNLSGDRGQEYFSDGITEEILTALSRFRNLHVVAPMRPSSIRASPSTCSGSGPRSGPSMCSKGACAVPARPCA